MLIIPKGESPWVRSKAQCHFARDCLKQFGSPKKTLAKGSEFGRRWGCRAISRRLHQAIKKLQQLNTDPITAKEEVEEQQTYSWQMRVAQK